MTNAKKLISFLLAFTALLSCLMLPVSADSGDDSEAGIMPLYNNVSDAKGSLTISSSGLLTVTNYYYGTKNITEKCVITVKIEKKTLGIFWKDIDVGSANGYWVETIYNYHYSGTRQLQLTTGKGTYRATITFEISGTGGATDVITRQYTATY